MTLLPYSIIFTISCIIFCAVITYILANRQHLDIMHGMMIGMTMGMLAGLITATLFLLPTGHFLFGLIIGSSVGILAGIPLGRLGGHLGVLEGIVAGPMGGMMGAMLGQMIRPYNLELFIPFFMALILLTLGGVIYLVHCETTCCTPSKTKKKSPYLIPLAAFTLIVTLGLSILLDFPLADGAPLPTTTTKLTSLLPPALQLPDIRAHATLHDNYQEAQLLITQSRYEPNHITVKKGLPLKLHITADQTAGCARDIIFPAFNIRKLIPENTIVTLDILPNTEGTFPFHCSMNMAQGKLVVVA